MESQGCGEYDLSGMRFIFHKPKLLIQTLMYEIKVPIRINPTH